MSDSSIDNELFGDDYAKHKDIGYTFNSPPSYLKE